MGIKEIESNMKNHTRIIVFLIFLAILSLLVITSFFGDFSLTGRTISNVINENATQSNIKIEADLTAPSLELDGIYEKVELKGGSNSFIYIGNEKFQLDGSNSNLIIINNYNGKIFFNPESIVKLNGKATKVTINGIPIEPNSKKTLKVSLDENFNYNILKVEKTVFIKELSYITFGLIKLNDGKNILKIMDEEINLKNFMGDIRVENKKIKISGFVEKLEILGDSGISVSS